MKADWRESDFKGRLEDGREGGGDTRTATFCLIVCFHGDLQGRINKTPRGLKLLTLPFIDIFHSPPKKKVAAFIVLFI